MKRPKIPGPACPALLMLAVMTHGTSAAMLGDVESWKQDGSAVTLVCGKPVVRLEFWADDVVRVTMSPEGKFNPASKHDVPLALEGCYGTPPAIEVTDGDALRMATKRMTVRVDKKPFRLHFLREDGTTLITRNPEQPTIDTELTAYFDPDAAGAEEHLFGAGEKAKDGCDLRGRSFVCYDHWGNGCPAPFVMSTAGYGLFVNSALGEQIEFDLPNGGKPFSLSVGRERDGVPSRIFAGKESEQDLDFFLLYGPGFEHIIDRFTTLTGKPPMFPKAVFGLSYHTRAGKDTQSPGEFTRFRNEGYPIDGCITFINRSWHEKSDEQVRTTSAGIHDMNGWVVGYLDSTDSYVGMLMWYTCAWQAHTTGLPAWRHLVLGDPGNPATYDKDAEFMIGDWLYFAPMLGDATSRPVYVPGGRWIDYFTGQVFDGPRTIGSYDTPLDRTPLFVKAGAIIPMGPELRHVNEKPLSPLTLDLYPYGCPESRFSLYEDDGISTGYLDGDFCITAVGMHDTGDRIDVVIHAREGKFTPPQRVCEVLLHGIAEKPAAVSLNGRPLDSAHDSKTGTLRVSFPDTGSEQKLILQR